MMIVAGCSGWTPRKRPLRVRRLAGGNAPMSDRPLPDWPAAMAAPDGRETPSPILCFDCPPPGYPTDSTRCATCPRGTARDLSPKQRARLEQMIRERGLKSE